MFGRLYVLNTFQVRIFSILWVYQNETIIGWEACVPNYKGMWGLQYLNE